MKFLPLVFVIIFIALFSGCSSKEVFEPKIVIGEWKHSDKSDKIIIDTTPDAALLESRHVMINDKVTDIVIEKNHRLISYSDGWIISASIDGDLTLVFIADKTMVKKFKLNKTVATASVKDDVLAVLFADNEMALYSIASKELLLKEQGRAPIIVNAKIIKPHFMNDLVLFLTLDGKIVIVSVTQKKKLRSIIVSSEEHFNNIISFRVVQDKLIAMTGTKLLSFAQKEIRAKYEIRDVIYDNTNVIYITTKQGELISLTPDLQVIAKVKFPFAHFLGLISYKDKIYALEKEGYLIELSKDLLKYDVYEVDVEDGFVYIADKIFFVGDQYISVE